MWRFYGPIPMKPILLPALALVLAAPLFAVPVFQEHGGILTIVKDGRRFEIPISSLSDEDQVFLKDWWPEG